MKPIHTFRPKTHQAYHGIWKALRARDYSPAYGRHRGAPHIILADPFFPYQEVAFWHQSTKLIVWDGEDHVHFTPEYWAKTRPFRKHFLVLHAISAHVAGEFMYELHFAEHNRAA